MSAEITDPDQCNCSRQIILCVLNCLEPNSICEVEILETELRGAEGRDTPRAHYRFRHGEKEHSEKRGKTK